MRGFFRAWLGDLCDMNENKQATHDHVTAASLPNKQDPAAYVPGTPTLGQYQPKSARAVAPPLLPGLRSVVFGRDLINGLPS